jgi:hypothetical protein
MLFRIVAWHKLTVSKKLEQKEHENIRIYVPKVQKHDSDSLINGSDYVSMTSSTFLITHQQRLDILHMWGWAASFLQAAKLCQPLATLAVLLTSHLAWLAALQQPAPCQ